MRVMMRLLLMAIAFVAARGSLARNSSVGDLAPAFELTMPDASVTRLSELRGRVIVLNFWATWCGPCRTELPLLDNYYRRFRTDGLSIFAVATQETLPIDRYRRFLAGLAMPGARRMRGGYPIVGALPTTYVIDRAGAIRYAGAGALDRATLDAILLPLLAERAPSG